MKTITSNIIKLIKHPSVCAGELSPITSQIILTDVCNLNCSFCTAGGKNRSENSVFPARGVISTVSDLKDTGCKGVEYTGGGEPTLHKDFVTVIKETKGMGLDIGMVTNGTRIQKLSSKIDWATFDWIRVSVNAGREDYFKVHGKDSFDVVMKGLSILSETMPGKFGVSYIYSDQPVEDIDSLLYSVAKSAPRIGYIRVGLDVLKYMKSFPTTIGTFNEKVSRFSEDTGIFADVQTARDLTVPKKCYMGRLKPSINADGSVYSCCISQHRKFGRLCHASEYKDMLQAGSLPEIDTRICPYCIYKQLNDFVRGIENTDVRNVNFI